MYNRYIPGPDGYARVPEPDEAQEPPRTMPRRRLPKRRRNPAV